MGYTTWKQHGSDPRPSTIGWGNILSTTYVIYCIIFFSYESCNQDTWRKVTTIDNLFFPQTVWTH